MLEIGGWCSGFFIHGYLVEFGMGWAWPCFCIGGRSFDVLYDEEIVTIKSRSKKEKRQLGFPFPCLVKLSARIGKEKREEITTLSTA